MKKIKKEGFVLAEAIVVAVFVLGMFTYLAKNIIPLISEYDKALNYDNPQQVYAANILLDEFIQSYSTSSPNGPLDEASFDFDDDYYKELKTALNIKQIVYVPPKSSGPDCEKLTDGTNRAMIEYCDSLNNKFTVDCSLSVENNQNNVFLIQFENDEFSYFIFKVHYK